MKVTLQSDFDLTDAACLVATGRPMSDWFKIIEGMPELEGKRRETLAYLYDHGQKNAWWPTTIWVEMQRAKGVTLKDGRPDGYNICVTKSVAKPVAEVFGAFQNSLVEKWFGDGAQVESDGGIRDSVGNRGTAVRIRENKDLRYKWLTSGVEDETDVDITFVQTGPKTGITLTHNRIQSRAEADGLRKAWGEALSRLKTLLEES